MMKRRRTRAEIGELIRTARELKGMSMTELGRRTGYVKQQTASAAVKRWETGELAVPLEKVRDVAEALEIPVNMLIP